MGRRRWRGGRVGFLEGACQGFEDLGGAEGFGDDCGVACLCDLFGRRPAREGSCKKRDGETVGKLFAGRDFSCNSGKSGRVEKLSLLLCFFR